jgi:hypothetical protein
VVRTGVPYFSTDLQKVSADTARSIIILLDYSQKPDIIDVLTVRTLLCLKVVYLYLCLYLCLYISVSIYVYISLCFSRSLSFSVSLSIYLCRSLSVCPSLHVSNSHEVTNCECLQGMNNKITGHIVADVFDIDNEELVQVVGRGLNVDTFVSTDIIGEI